MASGIEHALFYPSERGDRKYNTNSMEHWLKKFFTSGVFVGELQVIANNDMTISVAKGYTNVDGKVKVFPEEQQLQLETANATYDRIDSVVIERNDPERDVFLKVVTGGYSSNPEPLAPIRENGIYQMVIAQISVAHGAVRITQADIKDTRADTDLCGIVAGTVKEMDFGQFQAQFDSYMENYKVAIANKFREYLDEIQKLQGDFESNFTKWFDEIKAQLTTDAAGHLQGQIGFLTDLTTKAKNNLVAAINEVNGKEVEVVDPITAEEEGMAADAKLTGDVLRDLNAKIEWKLLGTKSSPTYAVLQIPIPEDLDFSELCVVYESYNAGNYIFNIPRQALTPNKGIRQGFYSSANLTGFASLNVSATLIQMGSYNQNGVAATNVVMTVYYR